MFYTLMPPEDDCDRVHLYPSLDSATIAAIEDCPIYQVALELSGDRRLVAAPELEDSCLGPYWMTGAQLHGDGSVTAQGRIPKELFIACILVRR
jgi:hypothetical protein